MGGGLVGGTSASGMTAPTTTVPGAAHEPGTVIPESQQ
jgi:hypothetical protein